MSLKCNLAVILSVIVLCLSIFTLFQLAAFLSFHNQLQLQRYPLLANIGQCGSFWCKVAVDFCLLCVFVVQHSFQKHRTVKLFLANHGFDVCERLLYNLGSCICLLAMMYLWQPIPSWTVWEISTSLQPSAWWIFFLIHSFGWLFIYSSCFIMDINELLGVKQVNHSIQDLPEPMSLKSDGLKRFYSHMRHPSFSAMAVILFAHPVMQIDRLLMAHGFVGYMILKTQVDDIDYAYQKRFLQRKDRDLNFND